MRASEACQRDKGIGPCGSYDVTVSANGSAWCTSCGASREGFSYESGQALPSAEGIPELKPPPAELRAAFTEASPSLEGATRAGEVQAPATVPRTRFLRIPLHGAVAVSVDTRTTPGLKIGVRLNELSLEELTAEAAAALPDSARFVGDWPDPWATPGEVQTSAQTSEPEAPAPGPDPWAGRARGMKCRTCMFYVPKVPAAAGLRDNPLLAELGRCRRHAPTMAGFPAVFPTDWCGDHKLDETKL